MQQKSYYPKKQRGRKEGGWMMRYYQNWNKERM